jgi:hypothetical protein
MLVSVFVFNDCCAAGAARLFGLTIPYRSSALICFLPFDCGLLRVTGKQQAWTAGRLLRHPGGLALHFHVLRLHAGHLGVRQPGLEIDGKSDGFDDARHVNQDYPPGCEMVFKVFD